MTLKCSVNSPPASHFNNIGGLVTAKLAVQVRIKPNPLALVNGVFMALTVSMQTIKERSWSGLWICSGFKPQGQSIHSGFTTTLVWPWHRGEYKLIYLCGHNQNHSHKSITDPLFPWEATLTSSDCRLRCKERNRDSERKTKKQN